LDEEDLGQTDWWKSLGKDEDVEVKLPHEQQIRTGMPSNHTKSAVWDAFLKFADASSHPNSQQVGSYSPQLIFKPRGSPESFHPQQERKS